MECRRANVKGEKFSPARLQLKINKLSQINYLNERNIFKWIIQSALRNYNNFCVTHCKTTHKEGYETSL